MKTLFTTLFVLVAGILLAQPSLSFQRCYGGTGSETSKKMFDLGNSFLVFGETTSNDGDVSGNHGGSDIWVFRNDNTGAIVWQKCFGGTGNETLEAVYPRNDGGYIMVGTTTSNDGDVSGNVGGSDIWVAKIDSMGNLLWQNSIGGSLNEPYLNNQLSHISGYDRHTKEILVYINSLSTDGEMTGNLGGRDIQMVRIDSLENLSTQNTLSSVDNDYLVDVWDVGGHILPVYADTLNAWIGTNTYPRIVYDYEQYGRTTDGGYLVYWETFGDLRCDKYDNTNSFQDDFGYYTGMLCNTVLDAWQVYIIDNGGFRIYLETSFLGCSGPTPHDDFTTKIYLNTATGVSDIFSKCGYTLDYPNGTLGTPEPPVYFGPCVYPTSFDAYDIPIEGGFVYFGPVGNSVSVEKRDFSQALEWTKTMGPATYTAYTQRPDTSYWVLAYANGSSGDVVGGHGASDIWLAKLSGKAQNIVSGYVWEDINANGTIDAGDPPVSNLLMQGQTTPGNAAYAVTQANGKYDLNVAIGNFTVSAPNPPLYHTFQPATANVTFSDNNYNVSNGNDFLLVPIPNIQDLRITLTALESPQSGFDRGYDMSYKNVGTQSSNATIRYYFDAMESYQSAIPAPDTLNLFYASWNVSNLAPSQSGNISLVTQVSNSVMGVVLSSLASIYPFANDQNITNNTDYIADVIVSSYDPNDILVTPTSNVIRSSFIANEEYLTYTVRFQNTGTAPAVKVVIKDVLPLALDVSSLEILSASHDFVAKIDGSNTLIVTYNNIMLPDSSADYTGSQGFIKYKIKPKTDIAECDMAENKAAIYFDFNAPVITNTVKTMFLPDPPVISVADSSTCYGYMVDISSSTQMTDYTYSWSSTNNVDSIVSNIWINNHVNFYGGVGHHEISLTQTSTTVVGCSVSSAPLSLDVFSIPNVWFTAPAYICQGDSIDLQVLFDSTTTYKWYKDFQMVSSNSNIYTVTGEGTYWLLGQDSHGCGNLSDTVFIASFPKPSIALMPVQDSTLCLGQSGDTLLLTVTATNADFIEWQKDNQLITNTSSMDTILSVDSPGDYRAIAYKWNDLGSCEDISMTTHVKALPLPIPFSIRNTTPLSFCAGESVMLKANVTGNYGYDYHWVESGNPILGAADTNYLATETGNYALMVTDSNHCSSASNVKVVTVNPIPFVTISRTGSIPEGNALLTATVATPSASFQWQKDNINILSATNAYLPATRIGNYRVIAKTEEGCKDTSAVYFVKPQGDNLYMINIYPNPASESLIITWQKDVDTDVEILFLDITGKEIYQERIAQTLQAEVFIPVNNLAEGVYLLQIKANNASYVEKIRVKR